LQGRNDLEIDGIHDRRPHDPLDQHPVSAVERPTRNAESCLQVLRVTTARERNADPLVEHPTHGQMHHPSVKAALGELIELPHGIEVLPKMRWLELWVDAPQVVISNC
jgi:hypothetical protein